MAWCLCSHNLMNTWSCFEQFPAVDKFTHLSQEQMSMVFLKITLAWFLVMKPYRYCGASVQFSQPTCIFYVNHGSKFDKMYKLPCLQMDSSKSWGNAAAENNQSCVWRWKHLRKYHVFIGRFIIWILYNSPGSHFNMNIFSQQYINSHYKNKMTVGTCYLYNKIL